MVSAGQLPEQAICDLIAEAASRLNGGVAIDDQLIDILASYSRVLGADRGYVFRYDPDTTRAVCTHEWCPAQGSNRSRPTAALSSVTPPRAIARVLKGETLCIQEVAKSTVVTDEERAELVAAAIQSLLWLPLLEGRTVRGWIGFESTTQACSEWHKSLAQLQVLAQLVAQAFRRRLSVPTLSEPMRLFRQIGENVPDMYAAVDRETGVIVACNQALSTCLGYAEDDLIGSDIMRLHDSRQTEIESLRHTLLHVDGVREFELRMIRKDGERVDVLLNAADGVGDIDQKRYRHMHWRDNALNKQTIMERQILEEQYVSVFETVTEAIMIYDLEGNIVEANPAACTMLGYTHEELIGTNPREYIDAGSHHQFDDFIRTVRAGDRYHTVAVDVRQDGTKVDIDVQGVPMKYHGRPHILSIVKDITDLRMAEEARRRLVGILEATSDVVVITDLRGKIQYINKGGEVLAGISASELQGKDLSCLHPSSEYDKLHAHALPSVRSEGFWSGQSILLKSDGQPIPVSETIVLHKPTEGSEGYISFVAHDISQMKKDERKFRGLLESAPDAMIITDGNGDIVLVNERAEDLFGYRRHEMLGQPVDMLLPQRMRNDHAQHRLHYMQRPVARPMTTGRNMFARRKDGSEFHVEISLGPLYTEEGVLISTAVRDVTERKLIEEELRLHRDHLEELVSQRTQELQNRNRDLESFSYSVSHDLRAPLRSIDGFCELLLEDYGELLDQQGRGYLDRARAASQRMGILIDDLLLMGRISRQNIRIAQVDLSEVARQTVVELQHNQPERQVKITIEDGMIVRADPTLMGVVVSNLLGNAWKYSRNCRNVEIAFTKLRINGGTVYCVRDNGIGFEQRYADKVFLPFHRLVDDKSIEGTGIGLATVATVIERHSGAIWAESEPGVGSAFYFTLQADKGPSAADAESDPKPMYATFRRGT